MTCGPLVSDNIKILLGVWPFLGQDFCRAGVLKVPIHDGPKSPLRLKMSLELPLFPFLLQYESFPTARLQ